MNYYAGHYEVAVIGAGDGHHRHLLRGEIKQHGLARYREGPCFGS